MGENPIFLERHKIFYYVDCNCQDNFCQFFEINSKNPGFILGLWGYLRAVRLRRVGRERSGEAPG